jgi:cellulose synthase/poly-beta-1,6-N-acetylglucosamine synthase-like glycosyltransferase
MRSLTLLPRSVLIDRFGYEALVLTKLRQETAHNEMSSIADVVRSCKRYCDEVIVVDDGSTDDTSEVSRAAGARVIRNSNRMLYFCTSMSK